ncbi:lipoate--protein ligase [Ruminococcaceae bacterium OttesenSCG-928-O06]|nr:lipoate--protein ligase [Ruminococcaceae bacterium OttesenSCG-928-O06]
MRYIESPYTDAYSNMALEEVVFRRLPRSEEYFMLWQNKNAVVVGRYQNTAAEVNAPLLEEKGVQVVRRLSGGGAMYQDEGNLNFTFVVNQQGEKNLDFTLFIRPVVRALEKLGAPAQQSSRNDIVIDGKKISGNAQYNSQGRTMHHGTLLYASDLDAVDAALTPAADKIATKGVASVRSRVTNIAEWLPAPVPLAHFKRLLVEEMFAEGDVTPYALTRQDHAAVQALRREKYATWEWNWGRSPAGGLYKKQRYPFGGVEVWLNTNAGRITGAHFAGDFFGNGEVGALSAALAGCRRVRQDILDALQDTDVGYYIHGLAAEALADLVLQ